MGNRTSKIKKLHEDYYFYEFLNNREAIRKLQEENSDLAKHRGLPSLIPSLSYAEGIRENDYRFLFTSSFFQSERLNKMIPSDIMIEMIKTGYLLPEYELQKKYSYYFFESKPVNCDLCDEYPAKLYRSSRYPLPLSFSSSFSSSFSHSEKERSDKEGCEKSNPSLFLPQAKKNLCEKCHYTGSPLKQILAQNYSQSELEAAVRVLLDYYEVPLIDFKGLDICLPLNKFEEFARIKERNFETELPEEYLNTRFFRGSERRYIRLIHTPAFKRLLDEKKNLTFEEIMPHCLIF